MSGTEKRSAGLRRDDRGPLVEGLPALPRSTTRELRTHWQKLIGSPPPGGLSRDLLMRRLWRPPARRETQDRRARTECRKRHRGPGGALSR